MLQVLTTPVIALTPTIETQNPAFTAVLSPEPKSQTQACEPCSTRGWRTTSPPSSDYGRGSSAQIVLPYDCIRSVLGNFRAQKVPHTLMSDRFLALGNFDVQALCPKAQILIRLNPQREGITARLLQLSKSSRFGLFSTASEVVDTHPT